MQKPVYRKSDGTLSLCPVCKECDAPIQFVKTRGDGTMPVNAGTFEDGDIFFNPAKHVSHFATCPRAEKFRAKKPASRRVLKQQAPQPLTLFNNF